MREVDVPRADAFIKTVRKNHGPSAAKSAKTVLSLLLGMAVRHGALAANPVRDVAKISAGRKSRPRALTVQEEAAMLAKVAADEGAPELGVPDLLEFLDGTGMRIGEAPGVRAEVIDLEAGVLEVCATAVRLKGKGDSAPAAPEERGQLARDRPAASPGRAVPPPHGHLLAVRRPADHHRRGRRRVSRRAVGDLGLLSPGLAGGVRNPSNANRDIREVLDRVDAEAYESRP